MLTIVLALSRRLSGMPEGAVHALSMVQRLAYNRTLGHRVTLFAPRCKTFEVLDPLIGGQQLLEGWAASPIPGACILDGTNQQDRNIAALLLANPRCQLIPEDALALQVARLGASTERGILSGRRLLVCRARHHALTWLQGFETLGCEVVFYPTLRAEEREDEVRSQALANIGAYRWICFSSRSGVQSFMDSLNAHDLDIRVLAEAHLAVVGPGTAESLRDVHLKPLVTSTQAGARGLLSALRELIHPGERTLLWQSEQSRTDLADGLRELGAALDVVHAYRTVRDRGDDRELADAVRDGLFAAVVGSPLSLRHLAGAMGGWPNKLPLVSLGAATAKSAVSLGISSVHVAAEPSMHGVAAMLTQLRG